MGVSPSSTGGAPVPVPPPRDSLPMPSPYGAPYGGGYGGYGGGPAPPMTPEQLQTAFMRGAPPYSQMGGPYAGYPGTWQAPPAPPARVEHAQTIRNDVNLRKGSLRMLCADSNPSQLYLDFMFDSNSPCAVTVFPVAVSREDAPAGVSLIQRIACHKYPHTGKRTLFRKGLGQQFSQAFRREEWIDTRAYTGFQLTTHPSYPEGRGTPSSTLGTAAQASVPSSRPEEYARLPLHLYPIIVVLETVPDSDPAFIVAQAAPPEGVTAPVMPPGGDPSVAPGAASSHVSLQVTYATLLHKPGEDARLAAAEVEGLPPGIRVAHDWIVKPLRQRIQVSGSKRSGIRARILLVTLSGIGLCTVVVRLH